MEIKKIMYIIQIATFVILTVIVMPSASWSTTYYVDATDGNDSNDGLSPSTAWNTLNKVNNTNFRPRDTILFKRDLTWNYTLNPVSGANGEFITYGAYGNGHKPLIRNIYIDNESYIKVQDFEFKSNTEYPVYISNSHHITVEDCEIYADTLCTAWAAVFIRMNSHHNKIINCTIEHRNTGIQCDALNLILNANYNLISGNTIGSATHYSISINGNSPDPSYECKYNVIQNNTIHNTEGALVELITQANSNLFEYNTISGGKSTTYNVYAPHTLKSVSKNNIIRKNVIGHNTATTAFGLSTHVYQYNDYPPNIATGNRVYNNVIVNVFREGIVLGNYDPSVCKVEDNYCKNNIVFDNNQVDGYQVVIANHPNIQDIHFENNIFFKEDVINVLNIKGSTYSVAERETTDPTLWIDNIQKNPKLDSRYHPLIDSPCIDAGAFLTKVTCPSGSGKTLTVSDAKYFTDGFGIIPGDRIQLENTSTTATIESINYDNNTITLTQSISWEKGQKVSLPYIGKRPDIGACESNFIINPPQNLRIVR